MRFIDRNKFPIPEVLDSDEFKKFQEIVFDHFLSGGTRKTQKRFDFEKSFYYLHKPALAALSELFFSKCAYTEQRVTSPFLDFHRPVADAMGFDSEISAEHYWWLQIDWNNWYLTTAEINSRKANYFPVSGSRTKVPQSHQFSIETDNGVLLDPCVDRPEWYLDFSSDDSGFVRSRGIHPSLNERNKYQFKEGSFIDRGEQTIELLKLNNKLLVHERALAIKQALKLWKELKFQKEFKLTHKSKNEQQLKDALFNENIEYLGAIRQVIAADLLNDSEALNNKLLSSVFDELLPEIAAHCVINLNIGAVDKYMFSPANKLKLDEYSKALYPDIDLVAHATTQTVTTFKASSIFTEPTPVKVSRNQKITSVQIKNFKGLGDVRLDFKEYAEIKLSTEEQLTMVSGWATLLGENGCGKSSILQAIALLLSAEDIDTLDINIERLRRNNIVKPGTRIIVNFGEKTQIQLSINNNGFHYKNGIPDIQVFVRAYGATRLLPSIYDNIAINADSRVRIKNLFDPRFPIIDVKKWLIDKYHHDIEEFNLAASTIASLIQNNDAEQLILSCDSDNEIFLGGERLVDLSDGYRSILALVCDIMAGLSANYSDVKNASGIILIDEIDAHLHPKWRMSIVKTLRREFPNIQFIVSTHEPLCLRGLQSKEVFLIKKIKGKVKAEVVERSPSDYRIEQLLTSEIFGLDSTIDPDIDIQMQRYYELLNKQLSNNVLNVDEENELKKLKKQVLGHGVLGYTRRDQMVYEAIDHYLAVADTIDDNNKRMKLKKQTLEKVASIWRSSLNRKAFTED